MIWSMSGPVAFLGAPSDGDIRAKQGKTEGQHQGQIYDQEQAAAVLGGQIGEPPEIAYAHGAACCGQNKSDLAGKMICFLFHSFLRSYFRETPNLRGCSCLEICAS